MATLGRSYLTCSVQLGSKNSSAVVGEGNVSRFCAMRKFKIRPAEQIRWRDGQIRACSERDSSGERDVLVAEFIRHVDSTHQSWPLEGRRPTHLMPPTTVVRVLMDALMRNDWPEDDSGIRTAFAFGMPPSANEMLVSDVGQANRIVRAWYATEDYLNLTEFAKAIRDSTYLPMLEFVSWEMVSSLTFHGPGDKRAVQAVRTICESGISHTYTFCLQKVINGVYKGCWMIVGVRVGDYANV